VDDLKTRLQSASDLTKDLPEAIRAEGFRLAFEELSGGGSVGKTRVRPARRVRNRDKIAVVPSVALGARTRRREGPKTAVATLIASGYLDEFRGIDEIRQELDHSSGLRFEAKAIATSVLRLLRERQLTRERGDDNTYRYRSATRA